jgi:hypothetical protein
MSINYNHNIFTFSSLGKVCGGLGTAASNIHKDIYKSARLALTDRAMPVRAAAAECLLVRPRVHLNIYLFSIPGTQHE